MHFTLGEQPEWINNEPATVRHDADFVRGLVDHESCTQQLRTRGYCILQLDNDTRRLYDEFLNGYQCFCDSSLEHKRRFATLQFEQSANSPNQYHGYSQVDGLKSQFMMRLGGKMDVRTPDSDLHLPMEFRDSGPKLFKALDQICRQVTEQALLEIQSSTCLSKLLDPLDSAGDLLGGYISSSLLDSFCYHNSPDCNHERYINNHASHTDSGLITLVVCTDSPGLEVLDQRCNQWVSVEECLHLYCQSKQQNHRNYAILFWSDSVCYVDDPKHQLKPCLHRVESDGCHDQTRYSVVYKQRTSPLATAPRYQEDYILCHHQQRSIKLARFKLIAVMASFGFLVNTSLLPPS